MTELANYRYYVDWNNDGDFSDSGENITAFVFDATWEYGRDYPSQLNGRSKAGSASITVDNSDGRFSIWNASGPYWGLARPGHPIGPGVKLRITMQIGSGSEVTMFAGYLENIIPSFGTPVNVQTATITAYGVLSHRCLQNAISTPMETGIKTGDAAALVLDAAGFSAADRDIETGQSILSRWWDKDTAINALRNLEEAEAGFLRETKDGKIAFEDRAHRLGLTTPLVSLGTGNPGDLVMWNLQQLDAAKLIFNHIEGKARTFDLSTLVTLWQLSGNAIEIPVGETITIKAEPSGYTAVADWTTIGYQCTDGASPATDLTSSVSLVATKRSTECLLAFTNNGSVTAYLISAGAKGIAVVEGDSKSDWSEDADSIAAHGYLPYLNTGKFFTDLGEVKDRCDHLLALYSEIQPIIAFDIYGNYDADHLAEVQASDLGRRIHVQGTTYYGLYIDEDFFVENLKHSVGKDRIHKVTYTCSAAVLHTWPASSVTYAPRTVPLPVRVFFEEPTDPKIGDVWINNGDTYVYDGTDWSVRRTPDNLIVSAEVDDALHITFHVRAGKYSAGVDLAEFRATYVGSGAFAEHQDLRSSGEGGTLVHDGVTNYIVPGIAATYDGAQYGLTAGADGTWFYAWRLHNAAGWGPWSDGNITPSNVRDYITASLGETHPVSGDWVILKDQATITMDLRRGSAFKVTIADDRTLEVAGVSGGFQPAVLVVIQGAGGGHSLAMGTSINPGGISTALEATAAGDWDYFGFSGADLVAHPSGPYVAP